MDRLGEKYYFENPFTIQGWQCDYYYREYDNYYYGKNGVMQKIFERVPIFKTQAEVEAHVRAKGRIGAEICPEFFQKAEQYARRKLNFINERAGREYGEDGYGDEYLAILTEEAISGNHGRQGRPGRGR